MAHSSDPEPHLACHAASRWAHLVVAVLDSASDIRTLDAWAHHTAMSISALKNTCRLAHVSPRRSLILARLMRVLINQQRFRLRVEDLLDVRDRRTIEAWLTLAGVSELVGGVDDFLRTQQIVSDHTLVNELGRVVVGSLQSCS
jgi:hypothetical protein